MISIFSLVLLRIQSREDVFSSIFRISPSGIYTFFFLSRYCAASEEARLQSLYMSPLPFSQVTLFVTKGCVLDGYELSTKKLKQSVLSLLLMISNKFCLISQCLIFKSIANLPTIFDSSISIICTYFSPFLSNTYLSRYRQSTLCKYDNTAYLSYLPSLLIRSNTSVTIQPSFQPFFTTRTRSLFTSATILQGWLRSVRAFRLLQSMLRFSSVFSMIYLNERSFRVLLVLERTSPNLLQQHCQTLWRIAIFLNEPQVMPLMYSTEQTQRRCVGVRRRSQG